MVILALTRQVKLPVLSMSEIFFVDLEQMSASMRFRMDVRMSSGGSPHIRIQKANESDEFFLHPTPTP